MPDQLVATDRKDFARLDGAIAKGLATFVEVGRALLEIRDRKLYRENYVTFEQYCEQRHQLTKSYAWRLIESAEVVEDLKKVANWQQAQPILPANEGQCRELLCVPDDALPEVWQEVCVHAERDGVPITAKLIRQHTSPYRTTNGNGHTKAFNELEAGDRLRDWLRAELDRWPEDVRYQAAHWIRQILEKEFNL